MCNSIKTCVWVCNVIEGHIGKQVSKKFFILTQIRSLICFNLTYPQAHAHHNFIEIALRHECSPVNLLHIFKTSFPKKISGGLLLKNISLIAMFLFLDLQLRTCTAQGNYLERSVSQKALYSLFYIVDSLVGILHNALQNTRRRNKHENIRLKLLLGLGKYCILLKC